MVFLDDFSEENMGFHVRFEERLQFIEFGYFGEDNFLCTFDFLFLNQGHNLKSFIDEKLLIEGQRLLEDILTFLMILMVGFFLNFMVHD